MNRYLILLILILAFQSCLDMFDKTPKSFIGSFYLRESNGNNVKYLIFGKNYMKDGFYDFVLREPIKKAFANDSIIIAESSFQNKNKFNLIYHAKGNAILKIVDIDSLYFDKCIKDQKFQIEFSE